VCDATGELHPEVPMGYNGDRLVLLIRTGHDQGARCDSGRVV